MLQFKAVSLYFGLAQCASFEPHSEPTFKMNLKMKTHWSNEYRADGQSGFVYIHRWGRNIVNGGSAPKLEKCILNEISQF